MNPAIAIKSCHRYPDRRLAQIDTWLRNADIDFFFLMGRPQSMVADALMCDVSDAFADIAPKILCACEYALEQGITNLIVADDDTYLSVPRLLKSGFEHFDYFGFVRNYSDVPYMQGSCYTLSERAMERIIKHKDLLVNGVPDDVAVGRSLYGEVPFTHEHRFQVGDPQPKWWPYTANNIIACHKMNTAQMRACHAGLGGAC